MAAGDRAATAPFRTVIREGEVYVESPEGLLRVGTVEDVVDLAGGPAWTIEYPESVRDRHPDLDTSDAGLVVDVADVAASMTHTERFARALRALPAETTTEEAVSPRLGMFVGCLLENLQSGLD
jgi:hypothetical protein